jgi:sigma-B regulation protein RsbU (phosphoserine phosphatase)
VAEQGDSQPGADRERYDSAACGLLCTAASGMITDVNLTFCTWLGLDREALVGKKRMQDLLTVGCKIFHQTHWMPLLQIQGSVAEVQLEMLHADGRAIPVLVNAIRRTVQGTIRDDLAVFIVHDRRLYERELLLARKRAEELLESERSAQEALARALRERSEEAQQRAILAEQLIGIVSHDLRSPLSTVVLGASVLGSAGLSSSHDRVVKRISNAAARASRLIEDLLDFTQARLGGGLRVTRRRIDVQAAVAEGVEELKLTWSGRPLLCRHEGPAEVNVDPDRLAQLITNLVNNAVTYGSPGHLISVTSRTELEGSSRTLTLGVHNHGEPIAPELLPHIFEALRRGEKETKHSARSVGLGLYIVQQIARAHGGEASVTSTREDGTTFRVSIPAD